MEIMIKKISNRIIIVVAASVVVGMLVMALVGTRYQRINIYAENERTFKKLIGTVSEGVSTIMLEADADIAQNFAKSLKTVPEISDYRILKTDGLEAFHENNTIHNVNKRIGQEEFIPRDEEEKIRVVSQEDLMFQKSINDRAFTTFYNKNVEGEPMLTIFSPMLNKKECHRCHGGDHKIRGVIKVTSSLEKVEKAIDKSWMISMYVLAALTLTIVLVLVFLIRFISRPLNSLSAELENITKSTDRLTGAIDNNTFDQQTNIDDITAYINKTAENIKDILDARSGR